MLSLVKGCNTTFRSFSALLLFISCITFHKNVFAGGKEYLAEQYRAAGYEEHQKGNLNEALTNYTKAIELGVENEVVLNDMGVLYEEIDLDYRAEQYYLRAIQVEPQYLPAYMNLAYFYLRLGQPRLAARYFKMRYELGDPADPWTKKAKEELVKIRPEYREWAISLEADAFSRQLEQKSREEFYGNVKRSQEHFIQGERFLKDGNYIEAIKEYDRAASFTPDSPKIKDAKNKVRLEMAKEAVKKQSEQAIKRLEAGDTVSARHEIQKILTIIPKEPILISR